MKTPFQGTVYDLKRALGQTHDPVLSLILINQFKQFDKSIKPLLRENRNEVVRLADGEALQQYVKDNVGTLSFAKLYIFEIKDTVTSEQLDVVREKLRIYEAVAVVLLKYRNSSEVRTYAEDDKCPDWFTNLTTSADFVLAYDKVNNKFGCEKHRALPSLMGYVFKDL